MQHAEESSAKNASGTESNGRKFVGTLVTGIGGARNGTVCETKRSAKGNPHPPSGRSRRGIDFAQVRDSLTLRLARKTARLRRRCGSRASEFRVLRPGSTDFDIAATLQG